MVFFIYIFLFLIFIFQFFYFGGELGERELGILVSNNDKKQSRYTTDVRIPNTSIQRRLRDEATVHNNVTASWWRSLDICSFSVYLLYGVT